MTDTLIETNRSLLSKTVDNFYVKFLGFTDNDSNILGRQVYSIERPSMVFNPIQIWYKGKPTNITSRKADPQEFAAVFKDDTESLAMKVIYDQLRRQTSTKSDPFGDNGYVFQVAIGIYSGNEEVVEKIVAKQCFISNVTHSEEVYSDSTENMITVTFTYNEADITFPKLDD